MSVEVTRLPSGLSVVTDRMPHLESASLGVWAGAGSRNEAPDEHGISHLLEHMAFKGTKRRTARQIAEEIEAVGGDLNASTSAESTGFYARVLKADVPLALDVLSDILSEPTFEPEELRREQNVIVQEIGAVEDTPDDLVFERLHETAFPKQPLGRSILGTPETVRSFNSARIRTYLSRNYRAPDMLVALHRGHRRNRRSMWRHMRHRVRRNGNRRDGRAGVAQSGGSGQRRPDRERPWGRMHRSHLGQRRNRHFLRQRLGRRLKRRLLGMRGSGQNMAVLLGLFVRCGDFAGGLLLVTSGAPVFFPTRARQALAQQFRDIFVDRTGVGLLLGDTEFR